MSLVSKVLKHTGHLERKAVHEEMETLIQKQKELQFEVHRLAECKFSQFHPSLMDSETLEQRNHDIMKNISGLEDRINREIKGQLTLSTAEFQSLTKQLSESKAFGNALDYLSRAYTLYETSVNALNTKMYNEAVTALLQLDSLLKQPLCQQDDKIKIIATMKDETFVQRMKLEQDMAEMWADCVKWTFSKEQHADSAFVEGGCPSEVALSVGFEKSKLGGLVEGLHMTNLLNLRMKTFAERFQKFIVPLILHPCNVDVNLKSTSAIQTLNLNILINADTTNKGKQSKQNTKAKSISIPEEKLYMTVIERLVKVLEYLHDMMLSTTFGRKDESDETEGTLMSLLGRETSEGLLETLQKEILAKAVPISAKDLAGFESVKTATHLLQEKLVSLGFISPDYQALEESVANVNLLFSNKKCALILEEARDLMTSDLLNQTVAISDNKPQGDLPALSSSRAPDKGRKPESLSDNPLSSDTFKMPDCQISENIKMLVQLAYTTLHEAAESSPECATQMYFAVENIFELFIHVVPTHHKHNIEKVPRMSALHHNNCMFVTHHLMTLGHQFALALPSSETVTFVPLIQQIRQSGLDCLLVQVSKQNDILLECLDEAGGFSGVEEEVNFTKCERAVKQVSHQLGHLHKVWQPILPINLYQKAMGKLIQAVVDRMADCITSLEDITQDACKRLTTLLTCLEEDSAHFLGIGAAVLPCHVQNWQRLTHVKTVINSSLLEIENLWSDGKGPLAVTFSTIEMKQMIRALFQNTDRRAALLSKIK